MNGRERGRQLVGDLTPEDGLSVEDAYDVLRALLVHSVDDVRRRALIMIRLKKESFGFSKEMSDEDSSAVVINAYVDALNSMYPEAEVLPEEIMVNHETRKWNIADSAHRRIALLIVRKIVGILDDEVNVFPLK
jgi:hypothetical protein